MQTVEHLLAAAAALSLDDLTIELDAPEPPIGDGSFTPFLEAFTGAGVRETEGEQPEGLPRKLEHQQRKHLQRIFEADEG